jgi:hypothetical protein
MDLDCGPTQTVVLLVCDLLWVAFASADVLARTTGFSVHLSHLGRVVVSSIFASTRVMFSYSAMGLLEAMFRNDLYYILCSLFILCAPIVRQNEHCT